MLLGHLNPGLKSYKGIFKYFTNIKIIEEKFITQCKTANNPNCLKNIESIIKSVATISSNFQIDHLAKNNQTLSTDELVNSFSKFNDLQSSIYEVYHQLQVFRYFYISKIQNDKTPRQLIEKINNIYRYFNLFLISSSDLRFYSELMSYWNGFIKPVSTLILFHDERKYFTQNINELNLRWNILNVELTKRSKKITSQTNSLLQIIHRRWNYILKTTLR